MNTTTDANKGSITANTTNTAGGETVPQPDTMANHTNNQQQFSQDPLTATENADPAHVVLPSIADLSSEADKKNVDTQNDLASNTTGTVSPLTAKIDTNTPRLPLIPPQQQPHEHEKVNGKTKSTHSSIGFSLASLDNPLPPSEPQKAATAAAAPQDTSAELNNSSYRPLNVEDALTYLEQVKLQFNSEPGVYNHFLDIMKDFKSQSIDTPGVIERVSTLFRGYPTLIQGFNTFLPHGYRIECSSNPDDPIKVTTPMGSSTVTTSLPTIHNPTDPLEQQPYQPRPSFSSTMGSIDATTQKLPPIHPSAQSPPNFSQYNEPSKNPADVEFSQAITYVNKIKNRFADRPEIYKAFLEILQTYQREQKPIGDVYAEVTLLFQDAPDLLDDFKKFLPDPSANYGQQQQQQQQQQQVPPQPLTRQTPKYGYGMNPYYSTDAMQHNLPPLGSFPPPSHGGVPTDDYQLQRTQQAYLQSQQQQLQQSANAVDIPSLMQNDDIQYANAHLMTQPLTNDNIPVSNMRSQMVNRYLDENAQLQHHPDQLQQSMEYGNVAVRPEIDLDPSIVPIVPEPIEPIEDSIVLVEESNFFDKAKKFIGNKQTYGEFLKILNLYTQDLLDVEKLVKSAEHYLGGNEELFSWFTSFVGYQDKPKHIENIVHEKHKLDLDLCEACGPSYKKLPKTDTFMPCSGRDDMCWEVLNDEWVGHPVWASEDSGYIAHRKNQYEETLFKIEEERHEYDFFIESNLRTIQTLETIASKISNMSDEEKASFKLPPGLGHTSVTIYQKVIRKVYDKERGFEIIDTLHEYPAVAVPIVLKRLKQKDEEWRRAQREWNKIWRQLEQKVYYKSLDHLGLTFKQADKKLLTTKQLLSEISSIKVDQTNKRKHWLTPKPKKQLEYSITDKQLLYDILSLADSFIHDNSNYSNSDKERLSDFLKAFISLFFSIPEAEVAEAVTMRNKQTSYSIEEEIRGEIVKPSIGAKRAHETELQLKDILYRSKYQKVKHGKENEELSADSKDTTNLEEIDEEEIIRLEAKKPWLLGSLVDEANSHGVINNRNSFNLFANTNIYIFFRHLTTLYERLFEVKSMSKEVTKEINSRKTVQFAKDLNLISTQLHEMGLDFTNTTDSYKELLTLSKRLIQGDIEHQWFEESLRQAFKNKAFKLYTIDKVIQALVKHAHTIITDVKTADIMALFEKDRVTSSTNSKEQILYRLQVRSYMQNTEHMFRIEFNKESSHISIQYIGLDDLTIQPSKSLEQQWRYYVTSYALSHPTEGVPQDELQLPFLEKVIEEQTYEEEETKMQERSSPEGLSRSTMRIKIDPQTYNLDIETGSFDVFSRKSVNKFPLTVSGNTIGNNPLLTYIDGDNGWKKNLDVKKVVAATNRLSSLKATGLVANIEENLKNTVPAEKQLQESSTELTQKAQVEVDDKGHDTATEEVEGGDGD